MWVNSLRLTLLAVLLLVGCCLGAFDMRQYLGQLEQEGRELDIDIDLVRFDKEIQENPLFELFNFMPFHQATECNGQPEGVGFGSLPMQCSPNITGTMFILPLFGTTSFNLTSNLYSYCNHEIYTTTFEIGNNGDNCQYNVDSNSSYLVYKQDWPAKIPGNAVLYQSMFAACSQVSSYWFATNGTASTNPDGSVSTYYCNENNQPMAVTCNNEIGCHTNLLQTTCSVLSPYTVSCTN